ncbi:MAG: hypothetical protein QNJ46_33875 [Leptolyngbyaceae cyanobacterium MO_188.B28]|nr:hypothetical protein [Leptolyngbyaceae cyanobacterium MO_188.B28]
MFDTLVIGIGVLLLLIWTLEVVFPKQKEKVLPSWISWIFPSWLFPKPPKPKKSLGQELGDALGKYLDSRDNKD